MVLITYKYFLIACVFTIDLYGFVCIGSIHTKKTGLVGGVYYCASGRSRPASRESRSAAAGNSRSAVVLDSICRLIDFMAVECIGSFSVAQ